MTSFNREYNKAQKTTLLNIRNTLDDICMSSSKGQPMKKWEAVIVIDSARNAVSSNYLSLDDISHRTLKMYAPNYIRTCNNTNTLADLTSSMIHIYIDEEIKKIDEQNKKIDDRNKIYEQCKET